MAGNDDAPPPRGARPDPMLKRLEKLVGTWELRGRTLDSQEDNISGWSTFEWILGGFFLQIRGEIAFMGSRLQSVEIIAYDSTTETFPAYVYSDMSGSVLRYQWDMQDDTVRHWTEGASYTGTFSEDGNTLSGGWRPDERTEATGGNAYDATMVRVRQKA